MFKEDLVGFMTLAYSNLGRINRSKSVCDLLTNFYDGLNIN